MTIDSLPIETIKHYAEKYANSLKYHCEHQKLLQYTKRRTLVGETLKDVHPSIATSGRTTSITHNTRTHQRQKKGESTDEIHSKHEWK